MIFIVRQQTYRGETAVEIVRALERACPDYPTPGESVQNFLAWSLLRLADAIPLRELEVSPHLPDETVSFNYLCLLDNYGIGTFDEENVSEKASV